MNAEGATQSLAAFLPAWAVHVPLTVLRSGIQSICSWTGSWLGDELPAPVYSFIQRKRTCNRPYISSKIFVAVPFLCFYLVSCTQHHMLKGHSDCLSVYSTNFNDVISSNITDMKKLKSKSKQNNVCSSIIFKPRDG